METREMYYLKLKNIPFGLSKNRAYLNFDDDDNHNDNDSSDLFLCDKRDGLGHRTKFSKAQVLMLDDKYNILDNYYIVSVNEENNKKYKLRLKELFTGIQYTCYLGHYKGKGNHPLAASYKETHNYYLTIYEYAEVFTEEEIRELHKKHGVLKDYELIEVEDA